MKKTGLLAAVISMGMAASANAALITYNIDTTFQLSHRNGTGNSNPPGGALAGYFIIDTDLGNVDSAITELSLTSQFPSPYGGILQTATYNFGLGSTNDTVGLSAGGSGNSVLTVRDNRQSVNTLRFDLTLSFTSDLMTVPSVADFVPSENVKVLNLGSGVWGNWGWQGPGPATVVQLSTASIPSVPVPAAVWLFGSGLIGLVAVARRRKS